MLKYFQMKEMRGRAVLRPGKGGKGLHKAAWLEESATTSGRTKDRTRPCRGRMASS
jgi:hypothetical protein